MRLGRARRKSASQESSRPALSRSCDDPAREPNGVTGTWRDVEAMDASFGIPRRCGGGPSLAMSPKAMESFNTCMTKLLRGPIHARHAYFIVKLGDETGCATAACELTRARDGCRTGCY